MSAGQEHKVRRAPRGRPELLKISLGEEGGHLKVSPKEDGEGR